MPEGRKGRQREWLSAQASSSLACWPRLGAGWLRGSPLVVWAHPTLSQSHCVLPAVAGLHAPQGQESWPGGLVVGAVIVTPILLFLAGAFLEGPRFWGLVVVQLLSRVRLFTTPCTAARQASLFFTISQSLLTHVYLVGHAIQLAFSSG